MASIQSEESKTQDGPVNLFAGLFMIFMLSAFLAGCVKLFMVLITPPEYGEIYLPPTAYTFPATSTPPYNEMIGEYCRKYKPVDLNEYLTCQINENRKLLDETLNSSKNN